MSLRGMRRILHFFLSLGLLGCASAPPKYCSQTGQSARETPASFKGNRQCTIKKAPDGQIVKDGPYVEWYPSGKPALTGEYKDGKKTGKWIEWEESGKRVSERWFDNGLETPTRAAKDPTRPVSTVPSQPPHQKPR